tara:strand:- start:3144 stop:3410 length:267 start_codon:yes stop_codon:yes gene_type:complete
MAESAEVQRDDYETSFVQLQKRYTLSLDAQGSLGMDHEVMPMTKEWFTSTPLIDVKFLPEVLEDKIPGGGETLFREEYKSNIPKAIHI